MAHIVFPWRLALVFVALFLPQTSTAQLDPWLHVQLTPAGRKVEVHDRAGKRISGTLESCTADSLRVRNRKGIIALEKSEVARVSLVTGRSRGRKALIASGVTAAVLGAMVGLSCVNGCPEETGYVALGIVPWTGIVGGIAALFPPHRDEIYSIHASKRPAAVRPPVHEEGRPLAALEPRRLP